MSQLVTYRANQTWTQKFYPEHEKMLNKEAEDGHQRRWVTVQLQEGCYPCVGNGLTLKSCTDVSGLEPAIWFKVLVLESVSVDCATRVVSWTTRNQPDQDTESSNQRTAYMEGECYDYDADIDELFSLAVKIIHCSGQEKSEQDYEQCLLRMLHCYILPKITLVGEDLDKVLKARDKQARNIQALDQKVIDVCKNIDACEVHLGELRSQFLPELEDLINTQLCSKKFLHLLLEDVSREEPRLRQQMDKAQDQVEHAKVMLAQTPSIEYQRQLSLARQQRNEEQKKIEALLMARELIIFSIPKVADGGEASVEHHLLQQYLDERGRLNGLKQSRNRILEQKNCALSVREMLESAVNDLIEKGYTDANDANALGSRATDVLQGLWKPEWQKLGERIATMVNNEEDPIGNNFLSFCRKIRKQCQDLIALGKFVSPSEYTTACLPFPKSYQSNEENQYEIYGLEDFVVDTHRQQLQRLRSVIFQHLQTATEHLSELFNNSDLHFKNKVRLCYEQCFYDKEHSFLACVYELAHHEYVDNLERDVQRLQRLPIRLLNLEMKDEWWLELFDRRAHVNSVASERHRPFSHAYMNGTLGLEDQTDAGLSGSYDMINDLDDFVVGPCEIQSMCISAIRNHSKSVTANDVERSHDQPATRTSIASIANETLLSSSAPASGDGLTMAKVINLWEATKDTGQCDESTSEGNALKRQRSKSHDDVTNKFKLRNGDRLDGNGSPSTDTFKDHFGDALQNMRDIFKVPSPLGKLKCLTSSLRKITNSVQELRMRSGSDTFTAAVNAEDLLPLLVLMMLQMEPWEVASMWPQLAFTEDLMAPFLAAGCHGWALVEFQMAQRVLHELRQEF